MLKFLIIIVSLGFQYNVVDSMQNYPAVITTWSFTNATIKAIQILKESGCALDAIEQGVSVCEVDQCDGTVGYGGSPDENSETTLDALIMDGKTMNVGAVGALRRIKNAISVARAVLDHTKHTLLAGELATQFAVQMGFKEQTLTTANSKKLWKHWKEKSCQPNFWENVLPDPTKYCGPYHDVQKTMTSIKEANDIRVSMMVDRYNHDTIGMVAVDSQGNVAAGTSTNGAIHKIPGRVGDSPIPGAGAYADNEVGGAAATGDGDIMMRFLPSFLAVEEMRRGAGPMHAAQIAMDRIAVHYPKFMGAIVTLTKEGQYGVACHGMPEFPFVLHDRTREVYEVLSIKCAQKENVTKEP